MSRRPLSLVALVLVVANTTQSLGAASHIAIDGVQAGAVLEWEGGDPRASVVTGGASSDGGVSKQPGAAVCAPLILKVPFPPSGPFIGLIDALCSNNNRRRTIILTEFDAIGKPASATEFSGALLREVQFPALDAANSAPGGVTLVFDVERSREFAPPATSAPPSSRAAAAYFRLAVTGLDGSGATRIEPITLRFGSSSGEIGATRDYSATPAQLETSNLTATILRARSSTWKAWFTDFVINGNGSDKGEKSGALEFLGADMKQVVFALRFEHMGILRLSRMNTAAGAPEALQAELYFEKISTGTGQTSGGSSDPTQDASGGTQEDLTPDGSGGTQDGASEETPREEVTPEPLEAVLTQPEMQMATGMLSGSTTSDTSGTPALNISDRLTSDGAIVTESASTPTRAVTTVGAPPPVTNPADQGSRDPAGFPRVAGLTRLDFSGQYYATSRRHETGSGFVVCS